MPDEDELTPEGDEESQSVVQQITTDLETPPEEPTPQEPTPPVEDLLDIDGEKLRREEARALLEFRKWAIEHPKEITEFSEYLDGKRTFADPNAQQAQPPVAPPEEEDDLADLPQGVRARLQELDLLREQVGGLQMQTFQDIRNRNLGAIEQAARAFQSKYGLNEATIEQLQAETARAGVFPAMVQSAGGDVERGALDAFEAIYFRNPENRQRELDRITTANKGATDRQRKAGKLAGSGGTTPRAPESTKLTPEQRQAAIIAEIAAHQRGGSE